MKRATNYIQGYEAALSNELCRGYWHTYTTRAGAVNMLAYCTGAGFRDAAQWWRGFIAGSDERKRRGWDTVEADEARRAKIGAEIDARKRARGAA